jgi:hypothetical protein
VSAGIEEARRDFNLRRAIVDLLDVQVRLIKEDGKAIAYVTCILYDYEIKVQLPPTPGGGFYVPGTIAGVRRPPTILLFYDDD